jgi:hypothetical protein
MKKPTPTSNEKMKQKYQEGLLTLLSLQPELSVQPSPTDGSQQDGNPTRQHDNELEDSAGIAVAAFNSILLSSCLGIQRQYNELNRHIKSLAVYLWHASDESLGVSQQFHVGQAIEELSFVRKESWNLRVMIKENIILIKKNNSLNEEKSVSEEVKLS